MGGEILRHHQAAGVFASAPAAETVRICSRRTGRSERAVAVERDPGVQVAANAIA